MPPTVSPLKRYQKKFIIENLLKDFHNDKPSKTYRQEVQDLIFSWLLGVGVPVLSIAIVVVIKLRFYNFFTDAPFLLFFSPIILSSWVAGLYSGFIATLLGGIAASYLFLPPAKQLSLGLKEQLLLLVYSIEGLLINYFIANQRKAKAKAEQVQLSFQLLLENTTDYGIIFLDPKGYITNANQGTYRLTGYKNEDLQGNFFSMLFRPEDRTKKLPEKEYINALKKGRSTDENYLQKKNGTHFWASGFTTSLWTANNQLYGFVKLFRDITEGKRQEKEKEDFISIAAHELKNPVSSINLYLQILQKYYQTRPDKEPQFYLKKASAQLQRLLDLITTLLDVSQLQQGKVMLHKEETDINKLIADVIANMQISEKQHRLIRQGKIKRKVLIDRRKFEEVLINLINNAIKYSPNAKKILIQQEEKPQDIYIHVKDFGIGMSSDVASKVFERFYRGQQKQIQNISGLGLGLYISSQIVHAHGGKMGVVSTPGKGSTFSFSIPTS